MPEKEKYTIEVKNTIRLTDSDGIAFDLDINAVDGVVGTDSADNAKSVVHITGGERISVRELPLRSWIK